MKEYIAAGLLLLAGCEVGTNKTEVKEPAMYQKAEHKEEFDPASLIKSPSASNLVNRKTIDAKVEDVSPEKLNVLNRK